MAPPMAPPASLFFLHDLSTEPPRKNGVHAMAVIATNEDHARHFARRHTENSRWLNAEKTFCYNLGTIAEAKKEKYGFGVVATTSDPSVKILFDLFDLE